MVNFISLSSGSNGNCYYIGNHEASILIDAGIGPRTIKKRLSQYGLSLDKIDFILVTHDHIDHVRALGALADRCHIPIYTTEFLYKVMLNYRYIGDKIKGYVKYIQLDSTNTYKGISFIPFKVPHDANETLGYYIDFYGKKFTFLTDTGAITDTVLKYSCMADSLIIEANYDMQMLLDGPYTYELKKRISNGFGHLCNTQTADIIRRIYSKNLEHIFLCHLSENNNTPEKAYEAISEVLNQSGAKVGEDITLNCLPRRDVSELFII
jgi:Metal-dependent hydrolases of the beta-lactamase superfamily I